MKVTTVILAAGQGTRMRSSLPKVLHRLGGRPLIEYSLRLAGGISEEKPVVVVGMAQNRFARSLEMRRALLLRNRNWEPDMPSRRRK